VSDRHLAEVIYRLSTTENDEGRYVLADYGDLDTRHLGSVYEGLLEHQFRIAPEDYAAVAEDGGQIWKPATEVTVADAVETVEKGSLYVTNDEGERKATGAYYTPDYVVNYIVEETIAPLVDDIREDLVEQGFETGTQEYLGAFLRRVTQLKILDPAMGSGHFLTGATGYLAEQVMKEVREVEVEMGVAFNEQHVRREIAKECIYGVDINGMAVELAKLSMWLETLAADRPLAFLDHHLKTGNSLVGSDITEVLSDDNEEAGGQLTLTQSFARARQQTLEHVMGLMSDLLAIDNERLEDIKSMEDLYDEIRDDPLYQRLFEVANVHTAEQFGIDVPDGVYKQMAGAIDDAEKWAEIRGEDWFASTQALAAEQSVFHWELEFPEVFFGEDGEKLDGAGFDAVIGNPPYVRQEQLQALKEYFSTSYTVYSSVADLYSYFLEQGYELLSDRNQLGFIVSNKFTRAEYGQPLREFLTTKTKLQTLCDFHDLPVFGSSVSAYPIIILFERNEPDADHIVTTSQIDTLQFDQLTSEIQRTGIEISQELLQQSSWSLSDPKSIKLFNDINSTGKPLKDYIDTDILWGIKTGLNEAFIIDKQTREDILNQDPDSEQFIFQLMKGGDAMRYLAGFSEQYLIRIPSGWTKSTTGKNSEEDAWEWLKSEFPGIARHLSKFREDASSRYDRGEFWWELRSCDYYDEFERKKIVYPEISDGPRFSMDLNGRHTNNKCYIIPTDESKLVGILNSKLGEFWAENKLSSVRGGYLEYRTVHLSEFPVITEDSSRLNQHIGDIIDYISTRRELNTSLLDHLGNYDDDQTLADIGLTQPPRGAAGSVLQETAKQKPNLRVGTVRVDRDSETSVEIQLSARYKPDDEDAYETDQWGYTETDLEPALQITDLTPTEADLIEAFVPVAVDEAGGFAGFRETATKTNSLVDRLRKLTLPALNDVEAGLESYTETKQRADELEAKIEHTDELIDEIVYDLYGLTDEEIKIVEEAVSE